MVLDTPRISVVIIFLDGLPFLAEAIDSVLAQRYRGFELILVDDGSSDGSSDLARSYAAAHPDRVVYLDHEGHANRGMSASRNVGIARARGEFVAFLDADDAWLPDKLGAQLAIFEAHPEVEMVAGAANYWRSWASGRDEVIACGPANDVPLHPPEALLGMYPFGRAEAPCPSTLMVRKEALAKIGGFEESFRGMYEDQAFLAKAGLALVAYYPSACWLHYRQHDRSCSSTIERDGKMSQVRVHFARWFADYLRRQKVRSPRIWAAAWRNRLIVWYLHSFRLPMLLLEGSYTYRRIRRQYWRLTAKPVRQVGDPPPKVTPEITQAS